MYKSVRIARNYYIDGVRMVAATMVTFFHFCQMRGDNNIYQQFILSYGWLGVPIFFVISGFSISSSFDTKPDFITFWKKRLLRIYPAYWLSVILIIGIVIVQKYLTGNNSTVNIPHSKIDIINTFFSFYKPLTNTGMMNWVYWTLVYELFFYLAFSICLVVNFNYKNYITLLLILFSCFFGLFHTLNFFFFFKLFGYFTLGIGIKEVMTSKNLVSFSLIILSCISILLNKKYCEGSENELIHLVSFIVAIIFTISIYFLSPLVKNKNWLSESGNYSYGLYLFHIPIGIYILRPLFSYIKIDYFIFDFFKYFICVAVSYLSYIYLEKPIMQKFK
jgi:peptidoglycan/LPS O-acetylase OafA/YrhL